MILYKVKIQEEASMGLFDAKTVLNFNSMTCQKQTHANINENLMIKKL